MCDAERKTPRKRTGTKKRNYGALAPKAKKHTSYAPNLKDKHVQTSIRERKRVLKYREELGPNWFSIVAKQEAA
jgi:hypothetical protein